MVRSVLAGLGAVAVVALAIPARADGDDYLARLAAAVRDGLDAAAASHAPKLVPPVPIKVTWKAVRLGSLDLGAPVVALTAGDLDGDGKGELYAVTSREVVAIGVANRRIKELGRAAFVGDPAVPSPRDVIGTAVIDGTELVASVSGWANELRVGWRGKTLVAQPGGPGFLVCPGERMSLAPGRNHFGDTTAPVYSVRCTTSLVDPAGVQLRVRAALTANKLEVVVDRCVGAATSACVPAAKYDFKDYGVAFEIADVDRDGRPEVIVSGAGAPGDPDSVKVFTLGGDEKRGLFRRQFTGGVVGITVVDGDGDGTFEVVAAVRLVGATRLDLWRLD
jgi:hypothetical protein